MQGRTVAQKYPMTMRNSCLEYFSPSRLSTASFSPCFVFSRISSTSSLAGKSTKRLAQTRKLEVCLSETSYTRADMYRTYQIFLMLLKLDAFFIVSFGIQFLVLVIKTNDPEFALTICALPILVIILALVVYGVRREDKIIMWLFGFSALMTLSYFLFKLIRILTTEADQYLDTRNYLLLFSGLSLFVVGTTVVVSVICYRNFGRGLKPYSTSFIF